MFSILSFLKSGRVGRCYPIQVHRDTYTDDGDGLLIIVIKKYIYIYKYI